MPDRKCVAATLSNGGYRGYIPVPEALGSYVYAAELCDGSCLEENAGWKIVDAVLHVYHEINKKERNESYA